MLGEELKATTVSKNYFNNIFNSISDIVFVMEKNGKILDLNKAGFTLLKYSSAKPEAINLFHLFQNQDELIYFQNRLEEIQSVTNMQIKLKDKKGKTIDCIVSVNKLENGVSNDMRYQGIIKDITKEKETESLVIRTIVDTQERERERFARDLHDSLGQQLSGIKFYLETLKKMNGAPDKKRKEILLKSSEALTNAMMEVKNLCFNIMPRTLENFGLTHALRELCKKMEYAGALAFKIYIAKNFPALSKPLEIAIFRIVQEFINNSIKHGKAKKNIIVMKCKDRKLNITLQDDGIGFDKNALSKSKGMGLRNVKSRIGSYNGEVKIESDIMKGTSYRITIPV